ncbi:hypothetical protein HAX54_038320 [Datura stramonium]|uniref:RING-type domain-containing protein n=1 Tax=Datura stramonium TaxID=4076 RepID=A0ABS8VJP7_DATST|nr:hypothetical protein [Datura stramonium]
MASSQVEIASSSPFGYVLNKRDRCSARDSNSFRKNFKSLIQTHLHSCISNQPKRISASDSCGNSRNNADLWVHHKTQCDDKNDNSPQKRSKAAEKWDKARNMVFSVDKENQETCFEAPNLGGVSSLVRKWKDFEADSKCLNLASNSENSSPPKGFLQECDESCSSIVKTESLGDWESDKTDIISKDSDVKESERLGVADIIKKLKFDNGNAVVLNGRSLPRVRTSTDHSEQQRCNFSPVLSSPRFIRGRQAFSDLLLQMERDRQRELEGLVERKAVSKFQQRGRIQALLRVRLIRRGAEEVRGSRSVNCSSSESNKSTHSTIMHLREKFNAVGQYGLADSRNTSKVAERTHESASLPSTPNRQQKENSYRDFKGLTSPQRELARSNSAKVGTEFSLYQQREEDPLKGLVKERTGLQPVVAESRSTSIALGDNTRDPSISEKENHHKPRSPNKEVVDNRPKLGNIVISNQLQEENHHEEVLEQVSPRKGATSIKVGNRFSTYQQREGDQHQDLVRERAGMQPGVVDRRSTPTTSGENTRDPCTSKEENHHKPKNPHKEVVDNIRNFGTFCLSNQVYGENHYEELCEKIRSRKVATSIQDTNLSKNQEMACSAKKSEGSCRLNQHDMDLNHQEVSTSLPSFTSQGQSLDDIPEKASWGNTSSEASHSNLLDFVESARPPKDRGANKQLPGTCNELSSDCTNTQNNREEKAANQCLVESESGSVSDYSLTASGWDELQSNEDWISDISRPRKEWEGLRQERYQEMLDPFSDNHDIQQLLHRKSVSTFLNSGLRDKIDQIMASRSQQLPNAMSSHVKEEVPALVTEDEDEVEDEIGEEEEDWDYDNDSEDLNIPGRQQYNEPEVLIHQNTSSQTSQSWNTNPDQEVTDDFYIFPSPSSLQSQSSNIYSQHVQPCSSSTGHPSTEMELIYEMRGHMEQIHQEIFEIRRSMKSCMNMQMELQRSIKQDVAAAISQLGQKSRGNSDNKGSNKGKCCICCEEPVDSLLYRCGHMCTCFKCAHELISGTGKCPVCHASIMDVVRAHTHS